MSKPQVSALHDEERVTHLDSVKGWKCHAPIKAHDACCNQSGCEITSSWMTSLSVRQSSLKLASVSAYAALTPRVAHRIASSCVEGKDHSGRGSNLLANYPALPCMKAGSPKCRNTNVNRLQHLLVVEEHLVGPFQSIARVVRSTSGMGMPLVQSGAVLANRVLSGR